jgi:hypothetical protein
MCLMLYLATKGDQPLGTSPELNVEEVETSREAVRLWFSLPTIRFIGAHTGCSCGFPSVIAEEPVEYLAEHKRIGRPPRDRSLRVQPFEVADQQQRK